MTKPLKVYTGWLIRKPGDPVGPPQRAFAGDRTQRPSSQVSAAVAAPSRAAVLRAIRATGDRSITDSFLKTYWGEAGPESDVGRAALANPGRVVVRALDDYHGEWVVRELTDPEHI